MIRTLTSALALALLATPVLAQDAPGQWSFGFGAGTDNRSKAASKTLGQEYVWVSGQVESGDGFFYLSGGLEGIDSNGSDTESELKVGMRPEIAGFDLDFSVAHKWQLDANPGADNDALEVTANLSRSVGPAKARLQVQYSPDGTGSTRAWTWVEGRVGWDFNETVSASAAIGRREQDNAIDYTGYNAGVTWDLGHKAELDVRWYGTDGPGSDPRYADALVGEISFAF